MSLLGHRYGIRELIEGFKKSEKIIYTTNGNRSSDSKQTLKKIEALLPKIGITRVGEISQLALGNFPVFQSSRPHLFGHTDTGQNSGGQGKGSHADQAKISCIMETIEGYCMEPKNDNFIRGSFRYLKKHHVVYDPRRYVHQHKVKKVGIAEPLMWTEALSLEQQTGILVPAENVFFPFFPQDYKTRSIFPSTSNGMAAGSSYLEAVIHGIYEVIERHYYGLWEMNKLKVEHLTHIKQLDIIQQFNKTMKGEFSVRLFALSIPGRVKNIPMVACFLMDLDGMMYAGYGCCTNVAMSVNRAVSEALQSYAVVLSGSREDMDAFRRGGRTNFKKEKIPSKYDQQYYWLSQTLTLEKYKKKVHDRCFRDLQSEYLFLIDWIHQVNFQNIFVVNLTRHGIDVPVVKVIIPGMYLMFKTCRGFDLKNRDIHRMMYRF